MLQWQAPSGGLFTPDDQAYFWQAVYWLMIQAAPLLMILIAAAVVAYVYRYVRDAVTAPQEERYEYTNDSDESEEDEES